MTHLRGRGILLSLATLATALILVPLAGMLLRAPWSDWPRYLTDPIVWPAIRLSLITTVATVAISMVLGTPLAWLLSRADGRAANWLRALVTVPVVLPPVVGGVALLLAYGRNGVVGAPLFEAFGLRLPFTPSAVVLAQVFVSLPFYVLSVEGAMRGVDRRYAQVAATLGSGPLRTFLQVGLPLAAPGIAAGAALAWARSLGEFGATITFAGNFAGETQTAPLAIYVALQGNPDAAVALSVAMLVVAVLILGLLRGQWLR
jgi:molybdate transport system permease protein